MKSIVTLGWSIWTCNSKSLQVYADQGSLLGSQEEAADLASRLTAAEHREAVLKASLSNEQAAHQSDARLAAAQDAKASADLQAAADKVKSCPPLGSCLPPLPTYLMQLRAPMGYHLHGGRENPRVTRQSLYLESNGCG